jgi:putative SOS response-associated peptidase YedK
MVRTKESLPDFRRSYNTLNSKGENLLSSPFFKDAALNQRCLVLSSGFYEWRKFRPKGSRREQSFPYHISMKDRPYFYMAGIRQPWTDKETGENIDTFSIVTSPANKLMALVHNSKRRMPTILPEELALEWIQEGLSAERIAQLATYQIPAYAMECYTIHKDFRIMDEPTEACVYPELPALGEDDKPLYAPELF